jgi:hypothetical protein
MTSLFLILFSVLLSPSINGDPPLRKIYKDQLKDPKKIVYVLKQISKDQLKAPGIR